MNNFVIQNIPNEYSDLIVDWRKLNLNGVEYNFMRLGGSESNVFVIELDDVGEIGRALLNSYDKNFDGVYLDSIRIGDKYRRLGLASKLYDYIELVIGEKVKPSPIKQSKEIKNYWDKKNKEKELNEEYFSDKIIAYHGTNSNFKSFNDSKPIFFVNNIDVAKTYGDIVLKAELKMENPVIFDFAGKSTFYFLDKWFLPSELADRIKEISNDIKQRYSVDEYIMDELSYYDYDDNYGDLDGIIMKDINDSFNMFNDALATNYVVFDKKQIKILKK